MTNSVAVLVDGGFFIKRYKYLYNIKCFSELDPGGVADFLHKVIISKHCDKMQLYRILYYDCPPYEKKHHNPVSSKAIDFSKTPQASFMREFHKHLHRKRLTAIRMGYLDDDGWQIKPSVQKELFSGYKKWDEITEDDVFFSFKQKGIDIKIGTDIASIAYKRLAKRIVLISGDSDFVPAAKLARREGLDVVLDPMWANIRPDLYEHIDGLVSAFKKPK
jgi:uncharacterized LabA/DUF88 family protein